MESVTLKRCSHCGEEKPANKQSFCYFGDKLRGRCRDCRNRAEREKAEARRALRPKDSIPNGFKRCSKCREVSAATLEFFAPHNTIKSGLQPSCRKCIALWVNRYREQNREKIQARQRGNREKPEVRASRNDQARRQRQANPEPQRAASRDWHARNRAYVNQQSRHRHRLARAADPEKFRERNRAFYRKNPELFRAHAAKRRARLAELPGEVTGHELKQILIGQKFLCIYCDCELKKLTTPWHADHHIPISRGGCNDKSNIVIACQTCNLSKGNKMPWDWMPLKFCPPE